MSDRVKTGLIKYGSCVLFVAAMLAWFLCRVNWGSDGVDVALRMACDGFTVAGVLLLCVGALIWCSNEGALDGISYAVHITTHMFIPGGGRKHVRYADYLEQRKGKRVKGYGFLLISGGITMALALITWVAYTVYTM